MPLPLSTMKFEAVPLITITVVDNKGHVNDLVQRLDDPDEPAQQVHHPRTKTATVKPSQFSADEHDTYKNGHVNNHVQELDTRRRRAQQGHRPPGQSTATAEPSQ